MLAEQERLTSEYNQPAMPDMTPRMPGTEGWPASQAFRRYGANISKPSGTYVVSHERDSNNLTIHIWKNFVVRGIVGETTQNFTEAEVLAICRAFEPVFGATNDNGQIWRNEVTRVGRADRAIQDPQRRNTSTTRYSIYLTVDWDRRGQLRIEIKPTQGTITQ
ncbi:MAG: hypothetical protein LBU19_03435, partial [Treponema sp.]|jgi:hypothetical protein|nr:hypothetical protein [Treponema sp.]